MPGKASRSHAARVDTRMADAERRYLGELVDEMYFLLENSRCRFTDVNLRTNWIVRKQAVMRRAAEVVTRDGQQPV